MKIDNIDIWETINETASEENAVKKWFKSFGFKLTHTGGGCTAYEKPRADGSYIMVTDGDACAPERFNELAVVGFFDSQGEWVAAITVNKLKNIESFELA